MLYKSGETECLKWTTSLAKRLKFAPSGSWRAHRATVQAKRLGLHLQELGVALIVLLQDRSNIKTELLARWRDTLKRTPACTFLIRLKLTKACEDLVGHHKQVFLLKLVFPLSLLPVSRVPNGRPSSVPLSVVSPALDPAVSSAHERSVCATRHCISKDVPRSLQKDVQNNWSIVMSRDTLKRTPACTSKHDSRKKKTARLAAGESGS